MAILAKVLYLICQHAGMRQVQLHAHRRPSFAQPQRGYRRKGLKLHDIVGSEPHQALFLVLYLAAFISLHLAFSFIPSLIHLPSDSHLAELHHRSLIRRCHLGITLHRVMLSL